MMLKNFKRINDKYNLMENDKENINSQAIS